MQVLLNEPSVQYQSAGSSVILDHPSAFDHGRSTVFASSRFFNERIAGVLQQLEKIADLHNDWDSYGAEAPGENAVTNARRFIIENQNTLLPFYFIAPGVNGEVMLEFNSGQKSAELYFNTDGSNELLLYQSDETILEGSLEDHFNELMDFFDE